MERKLGIGILVLGALALTQACSDDAVRDKSLLATAQPQIHVDPPLGEFSQVTVGSHQDLQFFVFNYGEANLLLRGVTIQEDTRHAFSIVEPPDQTTIPPQGQTSLTVRFQPNEPGAYSAKLVIECNDTKIGGRVEVPLATREIVGTIYAEPLVVDFGSVDPGGRKVLFTDVVNSGGAAFEIRTIRLVNEANPNDFAIGSLGMCPERREFLEGESQEAGLLDEGLDEGCEPASGVITMEPGARLRIKVVYIPTGGNTDHARIQLTTSLASAQNFEITLMGNEPTPRLALIPELLDFGPTELAGREETVILRNVGTGELELGDIYLAPTPEQPFEIVDLPAPGTRVLGMVPFCGRCECACVDEDGQEQRIALEDLPQTDCLHTDCQQVCDEQGAAAAQAGSPPACMEQRQQYDDQTITVRYTPSCGHTSIHPAVSRVIIQSNDLSAPAGGTQLQVTGRLDAPGIDVRPDQIDFQVVPQGENRTLSFRIYNIGSQELTLSRVAVTAGGDEFSVDQAGPMVIGPGDSQEVLVDYHPNGEHSSAGEVTIEHDSPCEDPMVVRLVGRGGGAPYCAILVSPEQLNYGTVATGRSVEKGVTVRSIGTGSCRFVRARVIASMAGMPAPDLPPPDVFQITAMPGPEIRPWEAPEVRVTYTPTRNMFDSHEAILEVVTGDPGGQDHPPHYVRLFGTTGSSEIQVLPYDLDFGLTTLGCASQTLAVTVYNVGAVNLTIDSITIEPPSPEFEIVAEPPMPAIVSRASPVQVEVRYVPQDEGPDTADLVFHSDAQNGAEYRVPMRGEGTLDDTATDVFTQADGQQVDVLFVVDNSGSMQDDQENLARNFEHFVQAGDLLNPESTVDFHIGIITTDLGGSENPFAPGGEMGPDRGKLQGEPRIISRDVPDFQDVFAQNVLVGTDDAGEQESGLETARAALSPTWLNDVPHGQCAADADCEDGEECVQGQCVGYNRGFLRDDASLEIVFVSDEEDQSPSQVDFYIDFFKSIKGFRNEGMLRCWAIVGDEPNGCQTNDGSADPGRRYIQVANATDGRFHSICDQEFAQAMQDIGHTAFSLRVQFFLSRVADPGSVTVRVAGRDVPQQGNGGPNWEYDPDSNSVIFMAEDEIPQPGDQVEITYRARCFRI